MEKGGILCLHIENPLLFYVPHIAYHEISRCAPGIQVICWYTIKKARQIWIRQVMIRVSVFYIKEEKERKEARFTGAYFTIKEKSAALPYMSFFVLTLIQAKVNRLQLFSENIFFPDFDSSSDWTLFRSFKHDYGSREWMFLEINR